MKKKLSHEYGQTVVEYLFLLLVVLLMLVSVLGLIRDRLIARNGECAPDDEAIACVLGRQLMGGNFRYFTIRR